MCTVLCQQSISDPIAPSQIVMESKFQPPFTEVQKPNIKEENQKGKPITETEQSVLQTMSIYSGMIQRNMETRTKLPRSQSNCFLFVFIFWGERCHPTVQWESIPIIDPFHILCQASKYLSGILYENCGVHFYWA